MGEHVDLSEAHIMMNSVNVEKKQVLELSSLHGFLRRACDRFHSEKGELLNERDELIGALAKTELELVRLRKINNDLVEKLEDQKLRAAATEMTLVRNRLESGLFRLYSSGVEAKRMVIEMERAANERGRTVEEVCLCHKSREEWIKNIDMITEMANSTKMEHEAQIESIKKGTPLDSLPEITVPKPPPAPQIVTFAPRTPVALVELTEQHTSSRSINHPYPTASIATLLDDTVTFGGSSGTASPLDEYFRTQNKIGSAEDMCFTSGYTSGFSAELPPCMRDADLIVAEMFNNPSNFLNDKKLVEFYSSLMDQQYKQQMEAIVNSIGNVNNLVTDHRNGRNVPIQGVSGEASRMNSSPNAGSGLVSNPVFSIMEGQKHSHMENGRQGNNRYRETPVQHSQQHAQHSEQQVQHSQQHVQHPTVQQKRGQQHPIVQQHVQHSQQHAQHSEQQVQHSQQHVQHPTVQQKRGQQHPIVQQHVQHSQQHTQHSEQQVQHSQQHVQHPTVQQKRGQQHPIVQQQVQQQQISGAQHPQQQQQALGSRSPRLQQDQQYQNPQLQQSFQQYSQNYGFENCSEIPRQQMFHQNQQYQQQVRAVANNVGHVNDFVPDYRNGRNVPIQDVSGEASRMNSLPNGGSGLVANPLFPMMESQNHNHIGNGHQVSNRYGGRPQPGRSQTGRYINQ